MKRIFIVLITLLLITGCSSNASVNQDISISNEEIQNLGGWNNVIDTTITNELEDIFYKAFNDDHKYKPTELLATQVVAGLNYRFKAIDDDENEYIIVIYQDLKDNFSITSIEPYK